MKSKLSAVAAACTFTMIMTASPSLAQSVSGGRHPHVPDPAPVTEVASQLTSPLRVAFGPDGSFLVAESFAGRLTSISAEGVKTTVVDAPGQEIAGVSHRRSTTYYFNNDLGAGPEPGAVLLPARLMTIDENGNTRQIADLSEFERERNPDGDTVYGVRDASEDCLAQAPYMQSKAELYSHPYSSAQARNRVYVGDAGANAILRVSLNGSVELVKAIPAEPITIDAAVVAAAVEMGLTVPECMLGLTYWAQAVPTDIEIQGDWLYYTVLPGTPGETLGLGKAYRTNLDNGRTQMIAEGLAAPTGIAVDRHDTVYVSELMGEGVSVIKKGDVKTVLPALMVSDVAVRGKTLAALTNALAETGGSLVTTSRR